MFLIEEDESLKHLLAEPRITVSDSQRATRPVEVWFGQPDLELRQRTYPYISVELIDINEANDRVMVGTPFLTYVPDGFEAPAQGQVLVAHNFPTPYDLDYQITVWSRHPRHDREILSKLLGGRLPIRFGQLRLIETNRMARLDMLGGPRVSDTTDENGKRLFRKVFTVRVSTELFPERALEIAGLIHEVAIRGTASAGPTPPVPRTTPTAPDFVAFDVTIP